MNIYEQEIRKKPVSLTILCILTFIYSGLYFLSFLSIYFSLQAVPMSVLIDTIENSGLYSPETAQRTIDMLMTIKPVHLLLISLCYALSVVGAAFMLSLKKIGFHLYTIAQILIFVISNFALKGVFTMGGLGIFWSVLFIAMYALHLKYMNPKHINNSDNETPAN